MAKRLKHQSGFTLLEVLIATGIFAAFAAAFTLTLSYNVSDSIRLEEEIILKELCMNKTNEILLDPPDLKESLTLQPEIKTFENNDAYEYILTWKRFVLPDYDKLKGTEEGNEDEDTSPYEKIFYGQIKDNLKELIWQLEVKVKNKKTGYFFTLSTWVTNQQAKVNLKKI